MKLTTNLEGKLRDLSGVCSALWATRGEEMAIEEDLDCFHAPLECAMPMYRALGERRELIAISWGWTLDELAQELNRRVDKRWIYMSGFTFLLVDQKGN